MILLLFSRSDRVQVLLMMMIVAVRVGKPDVPENSDLFKNHANIGNRNSNQVPGTYVLDRHAEIYSSLLDNLMSMT